MVLVDSLVCLPVPCSRRTLVFSLANTAPGIRRRGGGRSRSSSSSSCGRGNGDSSSSCVVVLGVVRSGFAVAAAAVAPGLTGKMMKPVVDKAVIVGGGLGGLAAAIQLRKIGIDVQVYERNMRMSGGEGALITLFPNGCQVLNMADPQIMAKIREAGIADKVACIVDPKNGEQESSWELNERMEKTYGQPSVAVLWQNVLNILSEAVPDDCKYMGYECLDVSQDEQEATVHFKRGDEFISVKAPLVIGADGIHSIIRSKLFGLTPPRDNGRTMWRAVIDEHLCSDLALKVGTISATGNGRTIFIINGVGGKLYWAYSLTDESTDGRSKVRSKDAAEMKARLKQEFKGWDLALKILEATDADLILERRVLDIPVLKEWSRGRVVLLGDAVHAVTPALGQGANLAFEDGLELALQLSSASDLRSALEAYEKRRITRAKLVSERTQSTQRPQSFYDWLYTAIPSSSPDQVIRA
ncbi:unnamed protein product [Sphagnum jensenii]|uniref:FAD-binding domain-containing protein n=1 Tax=Sphagnum jensenii TaxID=128206 RepID=A0ABP0X240_9BRYO